MEPKNLSECEQIERQILKSVGITTNYSIGKCFISENRFIHYMKFNKVPKRNNNVLLMTHGYLGSKAGYFRMYKKLMEKYHIISFDLTGQGLSSSDEKTPETTEKWIEYFTQDIDAFVSKMDLCKFHILAHSLGAFIMTHYADKHPEKVGKICLLSPGGVNRENEKFQTHFREFINNQGWGTKYLLGYLTNKIFKEKISPMGWWLPNSRFSRGLIANIVYKGKRLRLKENEQKLFVQLYRNIYQTAGSSEKCIGYLFDHGPMSRYPLMSVFERLDKSKDIHLIYGDFDWMDFQETEKGIKERGLRVSIEHVNGSEHQIIFQNPKEAAERVIKRLEVVVE